ncbi:MAG: Fe(3+) ABC transporter substrate-binding protein [Hyphomicrobiaceae bacterium]|nr:Fe(3+) ABC transporter substrate-binding protein [Hyphomicrobiaceae bacterium]
MISNLALAPAAVAQAKPAGEVNIYSFREPKLIQPVLDAFTASTGVKANVIFAPNGLIERLSSEGKNSPADVLLTNEFGLLLQATAAGVTQPVKSATLEAAIPANLRDVDGHWFGLTRRARIVYASKDRVKQDAITYEELADPKWRGKICIRSGQHTYNVALISSMIAHLGDVKAEAWLQGLKANLARKPAGGDREAVRDIAAGQCDIAIGNTYYMAAMQANPDQKAWADAVRIIFPNASDRGSHVNISGAALAANAPNKDNGIKLIEFLASKPAQQLYASANSEYPVADGIEPTPGLKALGELKADALPLKTMAGLRKKASELVDKVKFDQGPGS